MAEQHAKGIFTDPKEDKPKSSFQMFLEWYVPSAWTGMYPCLTQFVLIAGTLPVGSPTVERSFSQMKLIKNRLRSTLSAENLEWLMIVAMEGPEVLSTGQIDEAINEFAAKGLKVLV